MPGRNRLTERIMEDICTALGVGATIKTACQYAAISVTSYHVWMKRAQNAFAHMEEFEYDDPAPDEAIYVELANRVNKSLGDFKVASLANIEAAANSGHWGANAWKLERRFPDEYGRHLLEVTSIDEGSVAARKAEEEAAEQLPEAHIMEVVRILAESGAINQVGRPAQGDNPSS